MQSRFDMIETGSGGYMFKVSEVAEMLSVEKIKIFEALILHDDTLAPYVTKERHLTYVSEVGVRKLEQLLFSNIPDAVVEVIEEEEKEYNQLTEDDRLEQFIIKNEQKKHELRNELIDLKRQVNVLDREIRMKEEAIQNYQNILNDDNRWMSKLEAQLEILREDDLNDLPKNGFFNRLKK